MKVIHLLRKPCSEGTVAANVLKFGTGALNIDATRIGYESGEVDFDRVQRQQHSEGAVTGAFGAASLIGKAIPTYKPGGRWPANLVLQHLPTCEQTGTREEAGYTVNRFTDGAKPFGGGAGHPYESEQVPPSTVPVWACGAGCPVAGLDAQSGILSVSRGGGNGYACSIFGTDTQKTRAKGVVGFGDTGGASRFFKQLSGKVTGEE